MKRLIPTAAAAFIIVGTTQAAIVIHSWDFEGGYLDGVGAANGSVTGSTTVTTGAGHGGGAAAVFQASISGPSGSTGVLGTNGTVNLAHTASVPTITTPISGFSITYWVNMADDAGTANRGFFDFGANGTVSGYQGLYLGAGNQLNFRVDGDGSTAAQQGAAAIITTSAVNIEDSHWHHIALTFTPGVASGGFLAYLDGILLTNVNVNGGNTTNFTGNINAQNNPYLGSYNFAGTTESKGLNGSLDDFQIWSGVLSASEVSALAAIPEASAALLGLLGTAGLLRRRR